MRKILSVLLAVVMLAAMFVMPTSASGEELGLVITEVNADSAYWTEFGTTFNAIDDVYEFVEVYNASNEPVDLYDYSIAYSDRAGAAADVTSATKFTKFTPIASPETMKAAGIINGTIMTSNSIVMSGSEWQYLTHYAPINPETAILEPGQTAVIWMFTAESFTNTYGSCRDGQSIFGDSSWSQYWTSSSAKYKDNTHYHDPNGLDVEMLFREYLGFDVPAGTLILAIDANVETQGPIQMSGVNGVATETQFSDPRGVTSKTNDLLTAVYPSSNGRFRLVNDKDVLLALVKTEKFEAADALSNVTVADAESYVTYTYNAKATETLAPNGSVADLAYNYLYTTEASKYNIGKAEGNLPYGDWYGLRMATPGALLEAQAAVFAAMGNSVDSYVVDVPTMEDIYVDIGEFGYDVVDLDIENYINVAKAPYWFKSDASKVTYANDVITINNNTKYPNVVSIVDASAMPDYAFDYVLSYDIEYTNHSANTATYGTKDSYYAAVIFNHNGDTSYSEFGLTYGGYGINRVRYNGSKAEYDTTANAYYAGNKDAAGAPSIINRITNGKVLAGSVNAVKNPESLRMFHYAQPVNVTIYFDWEIGATVWVNGVKVSEAVDAQENEIMALNGNFGLGIYADPYTYAEISNISMAAVSEDEGEDYVKLMLSVANAAGTGSEPATGDATIYVVVAMAIAFVSLAAVVIIKRNKATN